ncbi:MAG TPA: hypothetical protein VF625_13505 [Longimicrobium sp.]|jgi:hypothetical protein
MPTDRRPWSRVLPWIVLVVGLLGLAYSLAGVAMGGSFSVAAASPVGQAHWRRVAIGYQVVAAAFALLIAAASTVLIRRTWRAGLS